MVTWGLGIEHEMKLRFENKKKIDSNYSNYYIDSSLIIALYKYNETNFFQNYQKNASKNIIQEKYSKKMNQQLYLQKCAIDKKEFPIKNEDYFCIEEKIVNDKYEGIQSINDKKKYYITKNTTNNLLFYIKLFNLYHQPQLYFDLKDKEKYDKFYSFDKITKTKIPYIYHRDRYHHHHEVSNVYFNTKKECFDSIFEILQKLYNGTYLKEYNTNVKSYINDNNLVFTKMENHFTLLFTKKNNNNNKLKNNVNLKQLLKIKATQIIKFITNKIQFSTDKNFIDSLFICYQNNIPHLDDEHFIEFKTIEYKNKNYQTILDNLMNCENAFMKYMTTIFEYFGLQEYGKVNYDLIGSREEGIDLIDIFNKDYKEDTILLNNYDYMGSYHIWITIPYLKNSSKKRFLNMHANLANKLQLLEPLFACHFSSPSFDIKHNKNYPSKLSHRQFLNMNSEHGTTDVSLLNGSNYTYVDNMFFKIEKNPTIYDIDFRSLNKRIIVNKNGTIIKNYNALANRDGSNKIFDFVESFSSEKINSSQVKVKSYYELLFKNKKKGFEKAFEIYKEKTWMSNKSYRPYLAADIRTLSNDRLMHPYDDTKYKKIYMPKENQFILYYIDKQGNVTTKPGYDRKKYKKYVEEERVGFEFRILDHFPTQYMNQMLAILPYLVIESMDDYPIETIHDTFVSNQFWHNEMANVITQGYKHIFNKTYIEKINKEFHMNIIHLKDKTKEKINSTYLLQNIYDKFENKYKNKTKNKKLLNKLKLTEHIEFISMNKIASDIIMKS
jgi:hypothetical protein